MEDADELKAIHRSGTNIMSFFDDNDKEHELQKQQSLAEVKKEEYLKSVELLKTFIQEKGTNEDLTRIRAIGLLIEATDFLNIPPDRKKMLNRILESTGPLAAASVSLIGKPVVKDLTKLPIYESDVGAIFDEGVLDAGPASTWLEISENEITVKRVGAISIEELQAVIPSISATNL